MYAIRSYYGSVEDFETESCASVSLLAPAGAGDHGKIFAFAGDNHGNSTGFVINLFWNIFQEKPAPGEVAYISGEKPFAI